MTEVAWAPPQQDGDEPRPYRSEQPKPPMVNGRRLRIGDRVRLTGCDPFVGCWMTGLVVNIAPSRYGQPDRARVLWDNQTVCMIETSKFVVTTPPPKFAVRPVMMPPLPRSA